MDGSLGGAQRRKPRGQAALPVAPNAAVPQERKVLQLPSPAGIGAMVGIVDGACRAGGERASAYAIDISNAYPTLQEQRLDWWMQIFLWIDDHILFLSIPYFD